jgi:hypothetical protein
VKKLSREMLKRKFTEVKAKIEDIKETETKITLTTDDQELAETTREREELEKEDGKTESTLKKEKPENPLKKRLLIKSILKN